MQLLGRKSIHGRKCTLRMSGRLSGPFTLLSSIKYHFLITGQSHPCNTQYWHRRALQACNEVNFCWFVFPLRHYPSSQGRRPRGFRAFPSGQMSNKKLKPFFRVSPSTTALALGRNMSALGQAPGEKSSGHAIPSLPPFPFSVLPSWGTGRSHDHLSGQGFISYKCSIPAPQDRKASLYKTILWAHT